MIGNSLKGKILVFATFFLGMVTGTLIYNVYDTRLRADAPEERSNRSAQREVGQFHDYLGLSPEQREQWNEIMQENRPEYDRLFEENRKLTAHNQARFEALREETRERVRQLLTAEQRQLYDDFNEKQRQRRQPRQR